MARRPSGGRRAAAISSANEAGNSPVGVSNVAQVQDVLPKQASPPKVTKDSNVIHVGDDLTDAALQRDISKLRFSRDITREFVRSTGNMKQVMDTIFHRMLEILDAEAGSLWIYDSKSRKNICHLAEGPAKQNILGLRLEPGQGIVGQVIANNQPDIVLDCSKDHRFDAEIDKKSGFATQSMICVPLIDGEKAFGALQIINKHTTADKQFTDEDQQLVQDMALSASIAVRNARLLESESRVKEMNTLMNISRQVVSTLDVDMILNTLVNTVNELVESTGGVVALLDEKNDGLFLAALSGGEKVDTDNPRQQALLTLMEKVRKSNQNAYIADLEQYKQKQQDDTGWVEYLEQNQLKSCWCTPLSDEEEVLGVLWLESDQPYFASGNKSDMLYILSSQATVSLRNASLFHNMSFGDIFERASTGRFAWFTGWRKYATIVVLLATVTAGLHYLPIFRTVSGPCMVEARFGRGVYLPVAGRITEVRVEEGDRVRKGDVLARLDETPIRLRLIQAESRLSLFERQIVEAKAAGDAASMSRALIERNAARAEVLQARTELEQVEVRAAEGGIILTPHPPELIGREFGIGSEILRIGDPSQFTVVMEVPEEDLLDISVGQEAHGVLRSRPGEGFRGRVRHVGRTYTIPTEALETGTTDSDSKEGFIAEIDVTESDVVLRPGMTGQASISTPESSVVTRLMRRLVNAVSFRLGV